MACVTALLKNLEVSMHDSSMRWWRCFAMHSNAIRVAELKVRRMFPQPDLTLLAYDIAKAMMDGFNRHYQLFRTESGTRQTPV
jgi:hypothetical protein